MKKEIEKRLQDNRRVNLLSKDIENIIYLDEDFLTVLSESKRNNAEPNEDILEYTVNQLLDVIYGINQYLDIDSESIDALKQIYRNTYERLDEKHPEDTLRVHYQELSIWLSDLYPPEFVSVLRDMPTIGKVENREYSAELQTRILGINVQNLKEPVLDLGCGKHAVLVNALRSYGVEAYGVDRVISDGSNYLYACSWFNFDFSQKRWGTILANMSFSNHFVYALQNEKSRVEKFSVQFDKILASLDLGGIFIYAPSIIPAEQSLDGRFYRIERETVYAGITRTKVAKINE